MDLPDGSGRPAPTIETRKASRPTYPNPTYMTPGEEVYTVSLAQISSSPPSAGPSAPGEQANALDMPHYPGVEPPKLAYRCSCPCGDPIMHLRVGICALCLRGDHWTKIALYLKNVLKRKV
jgi:hypothetical protein